MSQIPWQRLAGVIVPVLSLAATGALAAEPSPRLKYRTQGSVCMCASGLSEKEISMARRSFLERLQSADREEDAGQDAAAPPEKDSTQPTRRSANEDQK